MGNLESATPTSFNSQYNKYAEICLKSVRLLQFRRELKTNKLFQHCLQINMYNNNTIVRYNNIETINKNKNDKN